MTNINNKKILYTLIAFVCIFLVTFIVGYFVNFGTKNPLHYFRNHPNADITSVYDIEKQDDKYITIGSDSQIIVENKPNSLVYFNVDLFKRSESKGKIYYSEEGLNFNEDNAFNFTFKNGENYINVPNNAAYVRMDITSEKDFEFKIYDIHYTSCLKTYIKHANYMMYLFITFSIALVVYLLFDIKNEKKKEKRIEKGFLLLLLLSLFVIFFKFLFGGALYIYTDIGRDTLDTYFPYYTNMALKLKNFKFSFWLFDYGLGASNLNMSSWTFDPYSLLLVIISIISGIANLPYLLVFIQIFKIICLYYLAKKYLSYFIKSKTAICLASYLCAMNGYIFLWGQHHIFGTACIFFLLILCFIEHILNDDDKYKYIYLSITIALLLIYSFYTGYMILLTIGIYYLLRYCSINKKVEFKKCLTDISKSLYSVITGVLLSCIIFLPSCYNVLTTSSRLDKASVNIFVRIWQAFKGSFGFEHINLRLSRLLSNNSLFVNDRSLYPSTNYYELFQLCISIFIIFFIVQWLIYSIKNAKNKKDYILLSIKIILMYLLIFNSVSGLILNAFVASAYRYTFVIMPFFALMIADVWENIIEKNKINKIGIFGSLIVTIYTWVYSFNNSTSEVHDILIWLGVIIVVGYIVIILLSYCKNKKIYSWLFVAIIVFASGFEAYVTTNNREVLTEENYYLEWKGDKLSNSSGKAINWIKEKDSSYYRIEKNFSNISLMGDSMIEQRSTASWYNSTLNPYINEFYDKVYPNGDVLPTVKLFKLEDKSDLQALYLINSKYILSQEEINFDDIELVNKIDNIYIYQNNLTNSIAKFYNKTIKEKEYYKLKKKDKSNVLYDRVITNDITIDNNSKADVSKFYLKNNKLSGSVDADGDGILLISIPYQEGWDVFVDNKKTDIVRVDYGFIGVPISKGNHKISLKYNLPMFKEGILLSIIGLVNLIGVIVFIRFKYKKAN